MKVKDISVCMASPSGDKAVFDFARTYAEGLGAHLSCAAFTVLPPMIVGYHDAAAGEAYAAMVSETRMLMDRAWEKFEAPLLREDPPIEVRRLEVLPNGVEATSAMNARHADLVIVRQPGRSEEQPHADMLEGALLGGGRPVLVVPDSWKTKPIGTRILIGWDASREATRAMHDSLLIARDDAKICLMTIDARPGGDRHGDGPGWDVGAHLSRHGYEVEVRNEDGIGRPDADVIQDVAASMNADLVVLGGYRHSRLRQTFVPGVTRILLRESKVPLLLSH